jgi:hypothetical protein
MMCESTHRTAQLALTHPLDTELSKEIAHR